MSLTRTISPETARRFIIRKQHLDASPQPPMLDVIRNLGCLQLDPIRKVERPHRMILWSRLGQNDTAEQAQAVGRLLTGMAAHVNLIPLNPTVGYGGVPSGGTAVKQFQAILSDYDLPSTVRQRRGIDINAGCGQLRAKIHGETIPILP